MAQLQFRMPSIRNAGMALAIGLIALSVLNALPTPLKGVLLLSPASVLHGQVWQLVSYGLIEVSPMGVIFGAIILWGIGGGMEQQWGRRRFLTFSLVMVLIGSIATVLVSLIVPQISYAAFPGGTVLTGSLWVAYGMQIGTRQTNFWGLPVTGNVLAMIGAGFVALNAVFGSIFAVLPEAFALLATFISMRGFSPGRLLTRWRSWRFEKQYEKRSSQLRSIDGGKRNTGNDSDKFLH